MQINSPNLKEDIRALRIIHFAMKTGQVLFLAIAFFWFTPKHW
jgi:hypothetical protein